MTSGAPWSVKGIDPKAREIAKDLARRQGMTLGEWLNQMIFDDGTEAESEDSDEAPRRVAPAPVRPATESRPPRRTADDLERVLAAIDELSDRVQSTEQRQAHASARFEAAINDVRADQARVEGRLQNVDLSGGSARSESTMRALEGALGKIAGHVQDGERRSREAAALLRRELTQEMQRATDQMARQAQDVENRSADAIAQVGAEVTRVSSLVEQRLRRADDAQAEALEKLGGEIARITERLSERIAAAERRSAQAIDDVGEQMARVTDRIHQRQERSSSELADRMRQSEERTAKMLEEAREKLERRLNKRDGGEALADEANAFAARWGAEEPAPAPAALAAPQPQVQAPPPPPAPVQAARPQPAPEPSPAFLEPPPLGVDALLANIDSLLDENILHAPQAFGRPEPQPVQVAPRPAPPVHQAAPQPAPQPAPRPALHPVAAPPPVAAAPYVVEAEPRAAAEILRPLPVEDPAETPEDLRPSTRDLIAAARAAARVHVEEPVFRAPEPAVFAEPQPHPEPLFAGSTHRKAGMSGGMRGMLLTSAAVVSLGVAAAGYAVTHPEAVAALRRHTAKTAEADKPISVGPASNTAAPATQAMALTDPKAAAPAPESDAEAMFRDASARVDAGDASGVAPLRTAANLGYAPAQRRLGKLYEDGGAGVQKDEVEGRRWTQRAAANGDPRGMHNLGLDYYEGTGGIKNMAVAAQWFQRAAELGLRDSQYNLARFYEAGLGVKQDLATAYKWYLIAGRAGDTEAASRGEAMKMQLSPEVRAGVEKAALSFRPDQPAPPASMTAALKGASPQQLALAQRALSKLGYYKGQDDGAPSQGLGEAIQSYQRDRGLAANGTLSPELMQTFSNVTR